MIILEALDIESDPEDGILSHSYMMSGSVAEAHAPLSRGWDTLQQLRAPPSQQADLGALLQAFCAPLDELIVNR